MGGVAVRTSNRKRRRWVAAVTALFAASVSGVHGSTSAATNAGSAPVVELPETYPDLVPDVTDVQVFTPYDFDPVTGELILHPPKLAFDTWSQNLGTVAFDLFTDDATNLENPSVSQCVSWVTELCVERRQVGGFEVHRAHNHMHFLDFARYELRKVSRNGRIDMTERGLLDVSEKVSFCMFDLARVRDDGRPTQRYTFCTATEQGISAGWADVYGAGLAGQQLRPAAGLVDGLYAIVVTLDYAGRIWESDDTNNTVVVIVEVEDDVTRASIVEKYGK